MNYHESDILIMEEARRDVARRIRSEQADGFNQQGEGEDMTEKLFSGEPGAFGGLSNERELAKVCPEKFNETNDWSTYAMKLFFSGGSLKNWDWKEADSKKRSRQLACFKAVISTFDLPHEDKQAVAGWMLSEMLNKVPQWEAA